MKTIKYNLLISVFFVLLILLNVAGFLVSVYAFPEKSLMENGWEYMNSSLFKIITGTLVFPIILILLENKFKIIQAAREKRVKEVEAIKQNQVNKRREILDSIDSNWNSLYEQVNELKYFVVDVGDNNETLRRLAEIQKKLINSVLDWDKNVNELYYYYPRLKDLEPVYLYFVNLYVLLSTSIAWHIKQNIDNTDYISNIQEAYEVITGTTKNIWYPDFITILRLKNSRNEVKDLDDSKIVEIDEEIEQRVKNLKNSARFLMQIELNSKNVFEVIDSNPSVAFQDLIKEYKENIQTQKIYNIYDFSKLDDLEGEYYKVSQEEMMQKLNLFYTEEAIFDIAEKIGFYAFLLRLAQPTNDAKSMKSD